MPSDLNTVPSLIFVVPAFCCYHVGHTWSSLANRIVYLCFMSMLQFKLVVAVSPSFLFIHVHVDSMCEREWWSVYTLLEGQQEHKHYIDDNKQHHNEEHNNLLCLWGKVATQHGVEESHPLPTPPSWATSTSHQSPGLLLFPPPHFWLSSVASLFELSLHTPRPHHVTSSCLTINPCCWAPVLLLCSVWFWPLFPLLLQPLCWFPVLPQTTRRG